MRLNCILRDASESPDKTVLRHPQTLDHLADARGSVHANGDDGDIRDSIFYRRARKFSLFRVAASILPIIAVYPNVSAPHNARLYASAG